MKELRIEDLAEPELSEFQRQAIAYGETLDISFAPEGILADAREATGLSDFGRMDFLDRLTVICEEWEADQGLNGIGRMGLRGRLLTHAKNRLLIQDLLFRHPEIHSIEIERPIIVVGLPRSGTTHLLNLLAADSRLRAMPFWESAEPVPNPLDMPRDDGVDPRYQRCAEAWEMMQQTVPLLGAMHPQDPDHINEEIELMQPNFGSYNYEWYSYSPRWRDYYLQMDQLPHYEYMKTAIKVLQFQQSPELPRRWVLKSPMHLENLTEVQAVFPDATFVVTHRDPVSVIQSTLTMLCYGQRMNRHKVLMGEMLDYWTDRIEHLLRACVRDRPRLPKERTIDVPFHAFMANEMGMLERIYAKTDLPFAEETQSQLRGYINAHPRGKDGKLVYDLAGDFGADPAALRERFKFYFDAVPARAET
ncbi:MAG: sulfotransferase [Pseudomonadota bacterium]